MKADILGEILLWSMDRPAWQRDALRRLFIAGEIQQEDLDDLLEICRSVHGLAEHRTFQPLAREHLAIADADTTPVTLTSITHDSGVNALAPNQTITFGPSLTIVYGENGAGKSGYIRILKRACRARMVEDILGDVLAGTAPLAGRATIRFKKGLAEDVVTWTAKAPPSTALAQLSVFDSHCAPVYLRDKTDVAFRPFGLDVFDKLAAACAHLRRRLEAESQQLTFRTPFPLDLREGTRARKFVDTLTSLTKESDLIALATLSATEHRRLKELEELERDLKAADPKQRAREVTAKAARYEALSHQVTMLLEQLGLQNLRVLSDARSRLIAAEKAVTILRESTLTADLITGTGEQAWRKMWDAATEFSAAHSDAAGLALHQGTKCPVCQQNIGPDAATRLKHLAEFAGSTARTELREAERAYKALLAAVAKIEVSREDLEATIQELLEEDEPLGLRVAGCVKQAKRLQEQAIAAAASEAPFQAATFEPGVDTALQAHANALRTRAGQLQTSRSSLLPKEQGELDDLKSRIILTEQLPIAKAEIERKRRLAAYAQAIDDTTTGPITKKSTELTKRLISDRLHQTFQSELQKLRFHHLSVEIQPAGGAKGALFHKLSFSNAPGVKVTDVLSEGESRALSLAAFLTELSTSSTESGIVFDDPVSSLDHKWRKRIGLRLVEEAKHRQVIVFTHDLLLLSILVNACEKRDIEYEHQYIRFEGNAGVCSPDLPWVAMSVNQRIGVLRKNWQSADKQFRTGQRDGYEREASEIYAMLREAWERGVTEVLLNDVVEPFRQEIETQKAEKLKDISADDFNAVEEGMTECSRWMRGHDTARADGEPFPEPNEVRQRIDELESWAKGIRKRRN